MYKKPILLLVCCLAMAGCSTSSKQVTPAYVSPLDYQRYDCVQLRAEHARIQPRSKELADILDRSATVDRFIVFSVLLITLRPIFQAPDSESAQGPLMILSWPTLFALGGTRENEHEFARLKGEKFALEKASVEKKCTQAPQAAQG